jgi:nitrous oxidase accessory protein NosD
MIDAVRSVKLRSKMHLRLASGALLKAKGNAEKWSNVLFAERVSDVEVSGGEIQGERDRHQGTTGQWGHGITLRGASRVTIRDILISKCWGDGICMGCAYPTASKPSLRCNDVVVSNVACTDNRRQGMSIGQANNVKVYDSEFSYTNGLAPGCGIDIEPDVNYPGTATNVRIENCSIHHNQGNGIQVYKECQGTTITKCTLELNGGYGVLAIGAITGSITANNVTTNSLQGIGIRSGSSGYTVSGNYFYNNARRFRSKDMPRITPPMKRTGNVLPKHTEVSASQSISILSNFYYDK